MNKKTRLHLTASMLIGVIGISSSSNIRAEETLSMKKAVEVAILTNPEILQAYKNYESVVNDREAAFGRYLPSVDFTTSAGAEDRHDPLVVANNNRYFRSQNSLSLKQVIFDGFATKNEVARLDHTSKARLYELENMGFAEMKYPEIRHELIGVARITNSCTDLSTKSIPIMEHPSC